MASPTSAPPELELRFPWPRGTFDPPAAYAWLRETEPVKRVIMHDGTPVWLVTRYDDVRSILGDPRVSAREELPGFPPSGVPVPPPEERAFVRMDPPEHTVFRRLLGKFLTVKSVEAMRPAIQQLVDGTIDDLLELPRPVDLVRNLALPIPSTVISWLLGVRPDDAPLFNRATEDIMAATDNFGDPATLARAVAGRDRILGLIDRYFGERDAQADPGSDMLGQLVQATRDGVITRKDVSNIGNLLLIAGHDTTASMISLGTLTLLEHPAQLAELRENPALIPAAIEELLRYLTIVHLIIMRIALEDIEIAGVTIPAGEGIWPLNLSANRDDAHYPDAATFDIHRGARDHFAFGYGIHQCIGQPLARVELHVIFETLLRRIPTLQLAVDPAEISFKRTHAINGVHELPVTW
jgi:cytochrome P450